MPTFTSDLADPSTPLEPFWNECVGSGHAPLALRADWLEQLGRCRKELGMRHVRFHGLMSDRMGTFLIHKDQPLYSFHNIDKVYDGMLGVGVRPVVELSFMPSPLASGSKTVMHYADNVTPPKDWGQWDTLVRKLARHWIDRYGIAEVSAWPIEVWNEPNLEAFYTGKFEDYCTLYEHTSRALKEVDDRLRVGGPVTAKNAWLEQFVDHCEKHDLPLDFLSTHIYPTDAKGSEGDDTVTQLAHSHRGVLREKAEAAFKAAKGREVWYTEWSSSSNPRDPLHDEPFAAAYATKAVLDNAGLVKAYSWWTFSDIFEENYFPSAVFQGGFGMLTIYNTPKPVYSAYRLMAALGEELLPVDGGHETVARWVTRGPQRVAVMLSNVALPRHEIKAESVTVTLKHCPRPLGVYVQRVDDGHCNPKALWAELGSPRYLSDEQVALLDDSGRPAARPLPHEYHPESRTFTATLTVPAQGVALITIVTAITDESGPESLPPVAELPGARSIPRGEETEGDEKGDKKEDSADA